MATTIARPPKNSDVQIVPGIRTEETKTQPRVERATARLFERLYSNVNEEELFDALEAGDQRRAMLLFELVVDHSAKGLKNVLEDAMTRAGKLTAKEINLQNENEDDDEDEFLTVFSLADQRLNIDE